MTGTPLSSSPWIAALNQMMGPGLLPCKTPTGTDIHIPVGSLETRSSTWVSFPGAASLP